MGVRGRSASCHLRKGRREARRHSAVERPRCALTAVRCAGSSSCWLGHCMVPQMKRVWPWQLGTAHTGSPHPSLQLAISLRTPAGPSLPLPPFQHYRHSSADVPLPDDVFSECDPDLVSQGRAGKEWGEGEGPHRLPSPDHPTTCLGGTCDVPLVRNRKEEGWRAMPSGCGRHLPALSLAVVGCASSRTTLCASISRPSLWL